MGFLRVSGAIVLCLAAVAPAWAHGGFSFSVPARVQVIHPQARTSFRTTVGLNVTLPEGTAYERGEGVSEMTVFSVPSPEQRYRTATGGALPAAHSNILLPPATPKGDYTYIWENNGPE